ncbi:hypothetical protein M407DRAFT_153891 [Tulasnella calospora MUT 4182]|uniref:Uncharacterized protein n=1 Tax=Tulasnella calospora MUT 4182 TaxID=1051891 RepID=A0A0C3QFY8_9AGAM|nr:hypothetical protein M407DRAFT_153891 [Tulasnella calospora MUT 4182]
MIASDAVPCWSFACGATSLRSGRFGTFWNIYLTRSLIFLPSLSAVSSLLSFSGLLNLLVVIRRISPSYYIRNVLVSLSPVAFCYGHSRSPMARQGWAEVPSACKEFQQEGWQPNAKTGALSA